MLKVQLPPNQQLRQGQKSPGSLPSEKAVSSVSDNFGGQSALERAKNDALVQAVVRRFDAEIVGVTDLRDESQGEVSIPGADLPVRAQCPACRGWLWWRSVHGAVVCATCHPPAAPHLVRSWWWGNLPVTEMKQ
jgi:hypothetical protein